MSAYWKCWRNQLSSVSLKNGRLFPFERLLKAFLIEVKSLFLQRNGNNKNKCKCFCPIPVHLYLYYLFSLNEWTFCVTSDQPILFSQDLEKLITSFSNILEKTRPNAHQQTESIIHCCSFKSILSALIPKSEFVFIQKLVVYHFSTTCKKLMMNGLLCLRKVDFWKIDLKGPTRYLIRHFHFIIINKQL